MTLRQIFRFPSWNERIAFIQSPRTTTKLLLSFLLRDSAIEPPEKEDGEEEDDGEGVEVVHKKITEHEEEHDEDNCEDESDED